MNEANVGKDPDDRARPEHSEGKDLENPRVKI